MAATTKSFTLTTSAYQDVSEGAGEVWFEVPFNRNQVNDIRVVLASSLPAAGSTEYYLAKTARAVAAVDLPEDKSMHFSYLAYTDRVYLRSDVQSSLAITVFRK
jgi:hypothetical protein